MSKNKVMIFGAGYLGRHLIQLFGIERIEYIIDNNPRKWGELIDGIEIISPDRMVSLSTQHKIIIASVYEDEISKQLDDMGIKDYLLLGNNIQIIEKLTPFREKVCGCRSAILVETDSSDNLNELIELFLWNLDTFLEILTLNQTEKVKTEKYDYVLIVAEIFHSDIRYELKQWGIENVIDCFELLRYCDSDELVLGDKIEEPESSENSWADKMLKSRLPEAVNSYVNKINKYGKVPLFYIVEIETINRCNGGCSFCPVNAKADTREKKYMTDELFEAIIGQLSAMNYKGRISLFSNNEPFLDDKIVEKHKYARSQLPSAKMHLLTNGTKLSVEQFIEIIEYLDEMIIDNYSNNGKMIPSVKRIADYCEAHPELKSKVTICLRNQDEKLSSRGGVAPNRNEFYDFKKETCALPFQQIVIRPDGMVSLCCNDALGRFTLGDLSKESLLDIWYGELYSNIRNKLINGREEIELCKYCDAFQIY